jgi:hypothetical protein
MKKQFNEHGFHLIMIPLLVVVVGIIGFAGWYVWNTNGNQSNISSHNSQPSSTLTPTPTPTTISTPAPTLIPADSAASVTNSFDSTTAKVGDLVAGMTITKASPPYYFEFSGDAQITGHYKKGNGENVFTQDNVCFYSIAEQSLKLIPKEITDERDVWFCFTNKEDAKAMFSENEGTAQVTINNYIYDLGQRETWNRATLIRAQ